MFSRFLQGQEIHLGFLLAKNWSRLAPGPVYQFSVPFPPGQYPRQLFAPCGYRAICTKRCQQDCKLHDFAAQGIPMDRELTSGVYRITNKTNGKNYIGSTSRNFALRWNQHLNRLKANTHVNRYLQSAWNKYGESAFEFVIVIRCSSVMCLKAEQLCLDHFNASNRAFGYNINPRAQSSRGRRFSPETIERMRQAALNRSPEAKAKIQAALFSPEACAKRSAKMKVRQFTDSHREKIRVARLGIRIPEEVRKKMSDTNKLRCADSIVREKLAESAKKGREVRWETNDALKWQL